MPIKRACKHLLVLLFFDSTAFLENGILYISMGNKSLLLFLNKLINKHSFSREGR